jgi:hypothetical protein
MKVTMCLLAVFLLYSIASYASYNKLFRDSSYIFALNWSVALMSSTLWIVMIRTLNDTNKIVAASLVWDLIVTVTYALIPALMQGKNITWQSYAALGLAVIAVMWFKASTE